MYIDEEHQKELIKLVMEDENNLYKLNFEELQFLLMYFLRNDNTLKGDDSSEA